jgi:hypothetical protein
MKTILGFILLLICMVVSANNAEHSPQGASTPANSSLFDLTNEWGMSAIQIPVQTDSESEQLFLPIEITFDLARYNQKLQSHFSTGLYSLKNEYVLANNTFNHNISSQMHSSYIASRDLFRFGRFSAETGFLSHYNEINEQDTGYKSFVRSTYSLLNHGRFDLSLTASIESMTDLPAVGHELPYYQPLSLFSNSQPNIQTSLGFIGSFDLSSHWSVVGALTSTHQADRVDLSNQAQINYHNMALIGTTYSF